MQYIETGNLSTLVLIMDYKGTHYKLEYYKIN